MRLNGHFKILTIFFMIITICLVSGCGGGGGGGGSTVSAASVSGSDPVPLNSSAVILEWDAPGKNTDGTPLTDLAGYKIYYGTASNNYTESRDVGNSTNAIIDNLSQGNWCFTSTAYNPSGNESNFSDEICTNI
jgi:hypothetical protein